MLTTNYNSIRSVFIFILIMSLAFLIPNAYSVNEIDEAQIGGSFTQADTTKTFGVLVGTPINAINGFAYADWQRAADAEVVLAENATLYLEGGIPIGSFALSGYLKGTRDEGRIEGWQRDYGYFLRLPELNVSGVLVTGGAGNFARQEILELGIDAETTFNWRGFVELKHASGINLLIETTSNVDLSNPEYKVTPFTSIEVGDHFTLDLSVEVLRVNQITYTQTMINGKKTFEF